jgi:DNA-directed RNA polymerase subunit RPC12/RpoP
MDATWLLVSLVVPPALAGASWALLHDRELPPVVPVILNALAPGAGLAAMGRPTLETVFGVMVGQFALIVAGGPDLILLAPFGVIGAVWAFAQSPLNPMLQGPPSPTVPSPKVSSPPSPRATAPSRVAADGPISDLTPIAADDDATIDVGYTVTATCTECGAEATFGVLQHAAQCEFCGSHHLVVGHDSVLQVAIPEKITDEEVLLEAVLDHLRYRHYLKLYERMVAPLERRATQVGPNGQMVTSPEMSAAAERAERAASAKADAHRSRLAGRVTVRGTQRFLAPYYHQVGTLFQAAFGRDRRTQDKRLGYALDVTETVVPAYPDEVGLPAMGKLSYLKALVPAASFGDSVATLAMDRGMDALQSTVRNLEKKAINREVQTIRLGSVISPEVQAVVWRPWWVAEVEGPDGLETLLVDGASGSITTGHFVNDTLLTPLPDDVRRPGQSLRFQPMECPECGHEFPYDTNAVVHFCVNCHRVFDAGPDGKQQIDYDAPEAEPLPGHTLVPLWRFALSLRTAEGATITGLAHLRDGIDGTFDQIGEHAREAANAVWVPGFRCINPRLTAEAQRRLFTHLAGNAPRCRSERLPLDQRFSPWSISFDEPEARAALPLLLAELFTRRDLARANVHQIEATLFRGQQIRQGRLCYAWIPDVVVEPFRPYIGRTASTALGAARRL